MSSMIAEQTPPAAWRMLALGVAAQAAGTLLVSIPAYLIPLLHTVHGMPLARAGLLAAAPLVGTMLTQSAQRQYEHGAIDILQLNQTLTALQQAQDDLVRTQLEWNRARLKLWLAAA